MLAPCLSQIYSLRNNVEFLVSVNTKNVCNTFDVLQRKVLVRAMMTKEHKPMI